ncbi:MAG: signal peptide peptidase SppA [Porticoccaceae bacterium]|nr:signal peptide peptidase SppA [Porticoccaceae bacterium]
MTVKTTVFRKILNFFNGIVTFARALFGLVILTVVTVVGISVFSNQGGNIPNQGALVVALEGRLVDQKQTIDSIGEIFDQRTLRRQETLTRDVIRAIDVAANDIRISHLILELDSLESGGISKLAEIGNALLRFKATKKPIISFADNYSQQQYFLAAHADSIFLNSLGSVQLYGYGAYRNYFRDALDKLEIDVHVFRVGTYKSATEPLTSNTMSPETRGQSQKIIDSLWRFYCKKIEDLRKLPEGTISDYANRLDIHLRSHNGDAARLAKSKGLIDKLSSRTESKKYLEDLLTNSEGEAKSIPFTDYLNKIDSEKSGKLSNSKQKIIVITAVGTILDGHQPPGTIGGDSLATAITQSSDDPNLSALVLRVDSPGGGVFASEVIRDAIASVKAKEIPVVISMGSYAASGGYWIAAEADRILAMPTTLTGSIGVYSVIPNFSRSLNTLGIRSDGPDTSPMSSIMQLDLPMTSQAKALYQLSVDNIYTKFINLVSSGRNLESAHVLNIAQGKVWTGEDALEYGLVDELGDLKDAMRIAAKLAKLDQYEVEFKEPPTTLLQQVVRNFNAYISESLKALSFYKVLTYPILFSPLDQTIGHIRRDSALDDPRGLYLYCDSCPI